MTRDARMLPLHHIAVITGTSTTEVASVVTELASADHGSRKSILLAKLLLSAQAQRLVGALSVVGAGGARLLGGWLDELTLVLGFVGGILPEKPLPNCCQAELRKIIESSLESRLDAPCISRLAHVSQLRLTRWHSDNDDLDASLEEENGVSEEFILRVARQFCAGLAEQVTTLLKGLTWLQFISNSEEPLPLSTLFFSVLSTTDAALKCLRAAAPLATLGVTWPFQEQEDDKLAALLCIRALEWAFCRIEPDKPEIILRLRWRMCACRLFWDFLAAGDRPLIENPDDVARAFALDCVLPLRRGDSAGKAKQETTGGYDTGMMPEGAEFSVDHASQPEASCEERPPADGDSSTNARQETKRKKRTRQKNRRGESSAELREEEEFPATEGNEESESARREWNRLSLRMMMEMGWRAETGDVDVRS